MNFLSPSKHDIATQVQSANSAVETKSSAPQPHALHALHALQVLQEHDTDDKIISNLVALYRHYIAGVPPVRAGGSSARAETDPRISHVQEEAELIKSSPSFKQLSPALQEGVLALPGQATEPPKPAMRPEGKHEKDGKGGE